MTTQIDRDAVAATRTAIARHRQWEQGAAAREAAHRIATMALDTLRGSLIEVGSGNWRISDKPGVDDDDVTRTGRAFLRALVEATTSESMFGRAVDPDVVPAALAELGAGRDANGDRLVWRVGYGPVGNVVSDLFRGTGYAVADRDADDIANLISVWAVHEAELSDEEIWTKLRGRVGSTEW